jgi:hypothetical protein
VPATLLAIRPSDRYAVIELGIQQERGEMRWMASLFRPRVAVLTGIGIFHSEVFGSPEAIAREKRALLERLGPQATAVVNADDPLARAAAERLPALVRRAGRADDADVRLLEARSAWPHGFDIELAVGGRRMRGRVGIHGRHLAPLVAMAVAAAEAAGLPPHEALDAAGAFSPRVGRLSPVPGPRGSMLIVDDWKSRVPSAVAAVRALGETGARRRIAVLGEVQVDAQTPDTYRPVAEALLEAAHRVIAVGRAGPPLGHLLAGTPLDDGLLTVTDATAAARALAQELGPGDVALLHGAGHHDLELIGLLLDPGADPEWIGNWRRRAASRIGRTVVEVLAFVASEDDTTVFEPSHAEALTYVATTGHTVTPDGRFAPADDAPLVARAAAHGIAALLEVQMPATASRPAASRAVDRALQLAADHAVGHGHRGIVLDLAGPDLPQDVDRLARNLAGRLHAERLWLAAIVGVSSRPAVHAMAATAADLIVVDAVGLAAAQRAAPDLPSDSILVRVPDGAPKHEPLAASSLVQERGLRGVALPAAAVAAASESLAHRFQVRKRAVPPA